MVAQASLANLKSGANGYQLTTEDKKKGAKTTNTVRHNSTVDLVDMQKVLKRIVMGAVRHFNGEEVIDIPAREIAAAAKSYQVLESQRRMNLGKANPAPVKSEPKRGKRSGGALRPAVVQVQPEPTVEPGTGPVPTPAG